MTILPEYLKRPIMNTDKTKNVRKILKIHCLNTVCESARCPNKNECYQKNTATFLVMGSVCTRNCRYCNIGCEKPQPLDKNEPKNIAKALQELFDMSRDRLREMGQRGQALGRAQFLWRIQASRSLAVYEWLLEQRVKPDFVITD